MIDIKKLRLYPFFTNSISILKSDDDQFYNIIFYPENSSFSLAYKDLKIKRQFIRFGTILPSSLPRLVVNPKSLSQFYSNKVYPVIFCNCGLSEKVMKWSLN